MGFKFCPDCKAKSLNQLRAGRHEEGVYGYVFAPGVGLTLVLGLRTTV